MRMCFTHFADQLVAHFARFFACFGWTNQDQDKPTGKEFLEFCDLLQWQLLQSGKNRVILI